MTGTRLPVVDAGPDLEHALRSRVKGEVRFDAYTRHIYSTDASMYAIEPVGVVYPRDEDDVAAVVRVAAERGVPVLPRGGGTSLNGQAEGAGIVLDFSLHMDRVIEIDTDRRRARVQPGVVQDDLNRAVGLEGLLFAPDTSTGNRATIGGMIGNNSCGSRSARYGMTIDHVESLRVVLADGSVVVLGPTEADEIRRRAGEPTLEGSLYRSIPSLVEDGAEAIRAAMPAHWRRSGGYRLERMLPEAGPFNLANLVVGSEGTLAVVVEATLRLVPRPSAVAALVGHFDSIEAAVDASHPAMEAGATAVELVDRMILDLARTSPLHRHLAGHIQGDPGAILWVEFYADTAEEAEAGMRTLRDRWARDGHGYAVVAAPKPADQQGFRELRKAGLGLLMNAGKGRERCLAFVEDTAVDPARLGEFTRRFAGILERHDLRAGFYGHASAGTVHFRPFMDLTRPDQVETMRAVAEEALELVIEFGGMNSSEHGDGLARSEFNRRFFGNAFYDLMVSVKRTFDPKGVLNPGKKVEAPPMTEHLREPAMPDAPPLATRFRFDEPDGMRGAANRCMRIGACRKSAGAGGAMCPSYMATREEEHSTRGRANALVRALSAAGPARELAHERLHEVLDLCLGCKACQRECPLSVDMATLKSETLYHRHKVHGTPLRSRIFGHVRSLNRLGSAFAPVSNWPLTLRPVRGVMDRWIGIDRRRGLPRFTRHTLPRWFAGRGEPVAREEPRRSVVFLADSFTSYTEPEIGRAAIEVLEAAGWRVELVSDVCCGRSFISKGLLDEARERHRALAARLGPLARAGVPIVGCEPSCILTLKDELPALAPPDDADAAAVARAACLADDLIADALDEGRIRLRSDGADTRVLFHGHCHQKAAGATGGSIRMLRHLPSAEVDVLDAGCCGMAGSFGFEREHYDLSMKIGGMRLFPAVEGAGASDHVCATGVSCRQQIREGTGRTAEHPIQAIRRFLES